ncbi:MAG: aspartate/glutamate racemase family protein [Pseudomonadota bacterium]
MKTIGLIGGMSWESSLHYYRLINQRVRQKLGGQHSARLLMHSVDFAPIEEMQHVGDWDGTADVLIDAAKRLESGGADFFLIATNTMHQVADQVKKSVNIPLLHIADATGSALCRQNVQRVGLLGTAFTMEMPFYREHIERLGIEVVVPELHDRQIVHDIIYQELCQGVIDDDSREVYVSIINRLQDQGIENIILGCTEISMLIGEKDTPTTLFDTTAIHAEAAVELSLAPG